ncbi:conjugation protein [Streptococcus pneumoniae]|nr:conjugation protein [Streptococcus pneumoniae]
MRPLNEDKTWGAKSKKEYILDENGEKVKLKNGNYNYKTRKINTVDWNE